MTVDPEMPERPGLDVGGAHRSLRDEVTDAVRELIVTGGIAPGERLHERNLSGDLNVSRVPLREALLQLSVEGLVELTPRKGAFAAALDERVRSEIFDVREMLEPGAARLAALARSDADVAVLRGYLTDERRAVDAVGRHAADSGFHQALVDAAHHELLARLMAPLQHHVRRLFALTGGRLDLDMGDEHAPLVEAVADGDAARAHRLALAHVRSVREATAQLIGPSAG